MGFGSAQRGKRVDLHDGGIDLLLYYPLRQPSLHKRDVHTYIHARFAIKGTPNPGDISPAGKKHLFSKEEHHFPPFKRPSMHPDPTYRRDMSKKHLGQANFFYQKSSHPRTFKPPLVLLCFFCTPAPPLEPPCPPPLPPLPFFLSCGTVALISVVDFRRSTG